MLSLTSQLIERHTDMSGKERDGNGRGGSRSRRDSQLPIDVDLALTLAFCATALVFIFAPVLNETILRAAFGLVFLFFVPGYALTAALFPVRASIGNFERAALSFGMSLAISPLIGLGLNYTPFGIRLAPISICLTCFTALCVAIAITRRAPLSPSARFSVDFPAIAHRLTASSFFTPQGRTDKALTIIIVLALIGSFGLLGFLIAVPKPGETYTEFYLLGENNTASNYSTKYVVGVPEPVTVGIANHENRDVSYRLVIALNNSSESSTLFSEQIAVAKGQTREQSIPITADRAGEDMKLDFLLYKDDMTGSPYRENYLWVNVTQHA